jgi:NTP pyrophosphatase (non-canonical NTP hydrolase)
MNFEDYKKRAKALESNDYSKIMLRLTNKNITMMHGLIGLTTEIGELVDVFKKYVFYGKKIDLINVKEELGDLMWYMNLLIELEGWTWEEIAELNIKKLELRYQDKQFSEMRAANRDLKAERNLLEGNKNA